MLSLLINKKRQLISTPTYRNSIVVNNRRSFRSTERKDKWRRLKKLLKAYIVSGSLKYKNSIMCTCIAVLREVAVDDSNHLQHDSSIKTIILLTTSASNLHRLDQTFQDMLVPVVPKRVLPTCQTSNRNMYDSKLSSATVLSTNR
jgi:hypothetical protein